MKKEKINIGIIGLGRIGKMHAKNIHQNLPMFNLKSVADPAPDVDFIQSLENISFSKNIDNIISDKTIDAVIVCSPTPTHYEIIKKCATHRKHVFCVSHIF